MAAAACSGWVRAKVRTSLPRRRSDQVVDGRKMAPEEIVQAVVQQSQTMTRPVYRGQASADWEPESGAVDRLRTAYGEDFPVDESELRALLAEYHRERLIMPMQVIDGDKLSDLQRLSVLQHQGAATGLLDFTENPLVALWFTCIEERDKDAKVFLIDIGDPQVALNDRTLDDPFDAGQVVVYHEPDRSLGPRIVAQQSVFVICNPFLPAQHLKSVVVPQSSKGPLLDYLTRLGLSQTSLFGDIPGLAAANTRRSPLQRTEPLTPEQYRDRGNRSYQAGRYEDALAAYEAYGMALPDVAQPYCLKGDALAALGRFEDASLTYTKAIENLDRPIYLGKQVIVNRQFVEPMMSRALHYNRGNVRAAAGDHSGAIADFDIALRHGHGPKRDLLKNRGNSKFVLEMFAEAYTDFEAAGLEREGSDAALAMGNCKVMTGEFEDALQCYLSGIASEPKGSAAHCRANADQVQQIMETLNGLAFQTRREGGIVFVEAAHVQGKPPHFPFAGNQGNTGNIPSGMITAHGGKGYKGEKGFAVVIVPPAS